MVHPQKKEKLLQLADLITQGQHVTFVKYERTSHQTMESLRQELYKTNARVKVVKNTLLNKTISHLAKDNTAYSPLSKKTTDLKESTAVISLGKDWSESLKAFYEYAKKEKSLSFRFGLVDNTVYEGTQLEAIAKLPGKDQLIAKLIGTMKNPMSKTVYSLKFNIQKLAYVLSERGKQSES